MSADLPEGWTTAVLGDIADAQLGKMLDRAKRTAGTQLPYLRNANVRWGSFDLSDLLSMPFQERELDRYSVRPGDLFVCEGGEPGRCAIWEQPPSLVKYQKALLRVRPSGPVLAQWLMFALRKAALDGTLESYFTGSTIKHLPRESALRFELALPPLAEQHRIVAKVEELLEEVNRAKARITKVQTILKRFRQSVLATACSGELTREWRTLHTPSDSGTELVRKIGLRRKQLGLPSAKREFGDEGIELPQSELPEGWTWCRVGDIADVRLGGTPSRKEASYWNGSVAWVSSGEVANCRISGTAERITREGLESSAAKLYPSGTVLIAMIGEGKTRGQSAILDIEACTNQNAAGLVFDAGLINPEYVWYWALSEYEKNRDVGRGGNQAALNGGKVRALPVPLPPLDEQAAIVEAVNRALALTSTTDGRVAVAAKCADKLPQSILSKAFSGELVPTEAQLARLEGRDYEPASVLLDRIKNGAASEPTKMKKRSSKRQHGVSA